MSQRWVVVFGAGGHGKVVADVARSAGYSIGGFVDDSVERDETTLWDRPVLGWQRFLEERDRWPGVAMVVGVGDNAGRERCQKRIESAGVELLTLRHWSAVVAPSTRLGVGTVVMAGAVVNPDAVVETGCIVNTGAVVEHDCWLGPFVHLSPNSALGGGVSVGTRTHLGLGAVVLPGIRIGKDVRVGAGAAVHRDVEDGVTVVGVPARPIRRGAGA